MSWKKIKSNVIFTHPRITLIEDIVELPDGTQTPYLTYAAHNNAAMVICIDQEKVLLQTEYSYPPNEVLYQFPGGKVEPGESEIEGAIRELAEEAGLRASKMDQIGWFYFDNRRTSAKLYVYVAKDCKTIKKSGGDPEESIQSHWVNVRDVDDMIRKGEIVNYSLLAGWALYKSSLSNVA